jgi:predicted MFS family arabinose efflux permease
MLAMAMFGVGSLIGSNLIGLLSDSFHQNVSIFSNIIFLTFTVIVTLNFLNSFEFSNLAYLMAFGWGL